SFSDSGGVPTGRAWDSLGDSTRGREYRPRQRPAWQRSPGGTMTSTLTVMTWNVENLFPSGHPDGPPDRETYGVKIAYLATTIRGLNPDVVALQEVGDPQCVRDLASAVGDGWQAQLSDHPDGRRIRVGVLSPHPVIVEGQVVDLPDAGLPAVPDV